MTTPKWPGALTTFLNFNTRKNMNKTIKQVDKDETFMRREHGTVCLITETGRADRLLELSHKRRVNQFRLIHSPIDSWDI